MKTLLSAQVDGTRPCGSRSEIERSIHVGLWDWRRRVACRRPQRTCYATSQRGDRYSKLVSIGARDDEFDRPKGRSGLNPIFIIMSSTPYSCLAPPPSSCSVAFSNKLVLRPSSTISRRDFPREAAFLISDSRIACLRNSLYVLGFAICDDGDDGLPTRNLSNRWSLYHSS
jgi:hypothetical protein